MGMNESWARGGMNEGGRLFIRCLSPQAVPQVLHCAASSPVFGSCLTCNAIREVVDTTSIGTIVVANVQAIAGDLHKVVLDILVV